MHQRVDLKRPAQGVAQQTLGCRSGDKIALGADAAVFQAAQIKGGASKDSALALNCPVCEKHNVELRRIAHSLQADR